MDIITPDMRTKRLMPSVQMTDAALPARGRKRTRRSWSDEEKQRIVAEAMEPGASVADIARRYGANANLVFNWRRAALAAVAAAAAQPGAAPAQLPPDATPFLPKPCEFIPIGVFARAENEEPGFGTTESSSPRTGSSAARPAATARPTLEERAGLIEIDLADGTRLRVDAFVNERALRRVLIVLKATS
jgi:transposase